MAGPIYPDVPSTAGVPAVNRNATNPGTDTQGQLTADAITVTASAKDQWGLYRASDNTKALSPDSVSSVGYGAEYRIADYPLQDGKFETYDKVQLPFEANLVVTKGGSVADRREFLRALDDLRADTEIYNVVTPEWTHLGVNIARVTIDRSREQGANLITADILLREIRVTGTATFSSSNSPSAADPTSNGTTQPQTADSRVVAIAEAKPLQPFAGQIVDLKTIPLIPGKPAQSLAVPLNGALATLTFAQKLTGVYATIALGNTAIASNVLCRDGAKLLNGQYLDFPGDFAFLDTQGSSDPDYLGLGSRYVLAYAS